MSACLVSRGGFFGRPGSWPFLLATEDKKRLATSNKNISLGEKKKRERSSASTEDRTRHLSRVRRASSNHRVENATWLSAFVRVGPFDGPVGVGDLAWFFNLQPTRPSKRRVRRKRMLRRKICLIYTEDTPPFSRPKNVGTSRSCDPDPEVRRASQQIEKTRNGRELHDKRERERERDTTLALCPPR